MKICFLTRSLNPGGVESQIYVLARGLARKGHEVSLVVFYAGGNVERYRNIEHLKVHVLAKKGRWHLLTFYCALLTLLRSERPEILQSFLSAANILAVLVKPFLERVTVVLGIRASNMNFSHYDWIHGFSYAVERWLSRFADWIIVNSHSGREYSIGRGFPAEKMTVVPNGIDTDRFQPDPEGGKSTRSRWGIPEDLLLIGHVGRLDPMKDHVTFLKAAARFIQKRPEARFVCVGSGPLKYETQLKRLAAELGLEPSVIWTGMCADLPPIYSAFDVFTSTSGWGEGFPNVVGEAMACGVPCVVTDVGDSAFIAGECGRIVPPESPEEMATAWEDMVQRDRAEVGRRSRSRILENFSVDQLLLNTGEVYSRMIADKR